MDITFDTSSCPKNRRARFAEDMGMSLKRIAKLDENTIKTLAELGGLDVSAREELVSWSGNGVGDVRTLFRGEEFGSRAVRGLTVRGCPICLREDVEVSGLSANRAMAMRGHWQLRDAHLCVRHHHPLVELWTAKDPRQRSDIWSHLGLIADQLLDGAFDQSRRLPTAYDLWLDKRLECGSDPTWLAGQSLYASITFCNLLGEEILRGIAHVDAIPAIDHAAAVAAGFDVVKQGRIALRASLDDLAARASGAGDKPNKAFGDMYRHLGRTYIEDESFAPFREILRECILDTWPAAAGVSIMGTVLQTRRLHSISTASEEIGVGTAVLARFMESAGITEIGDPRPFARRTFDAIENADFLLDIQSLVGSPEFRRLIGATISQFNALVEDGVILPAIDDKKIQSRWRPGDGLTLIAELKSRAAQVSEGNADWESFLNARLRSGVGLKQIIMAIRDNEINVGLRDSIDSFGRFCVRINQIDNMEAAVQQPKNENDLTLTDFCRSVGLRSTTKLRAFLEAGHSPATLRRHPTTGKDQFYLSERDVASFHSKFMTLPTIAQSSGKDRSWIRAWLHKTGAKPFAPNGADYGTDQIFQQSNK